MATKAPTRLPVYEDSYQAGADLRTKQFYAVELTTENVVNVTNAATDDGFGILQNDPNLGEAAHVMHIGRSPAVTDGSGTAILIGDWVGPNTAGKLVKKATADYSVMGKALQGSSTDGAIISVMLLGPGRFRTAAG